MGDSGLCANHIISVHAVRRGSSDPSGDPILSNATKKFSLSTGALGDGVRLKPADSISLMKTSSARPDVLQDECVALSFHAIKLDHDQPAAGFESPPAATRERFRVARGDDRRRS